MAINMGILIGLLLSFSCCLAATTGQRSASLSTPKQTKTDGALGIAEVGKPIMNTVLKLKNVRTNSCDWGCDANKDIELPLCETKCDAEFSHAFEQQQQCQELCALKYLQCLRVCVPYKTVGKT